MIPNPISMYSKAPRWQYSKIKGLGKDNNVAQHFENFPYPIIKHKANIIMNMNIWRSCPKQLGIMWRKKQPFFIGNFLPKNNNNNKLKVKK
jgi:hypothetical protein